MEPSYWDLPMCFKEEGAPVLSLSGNMLDFQNQLREWLSEFGVEGRPVSTDVEGKPYITIAIKFPFFRWTEAVKAFQYSVLTIADGEKVYVRYWPTIEQDGEFFKLRARVSKKEGAK